MTDFNVDYVSSIVDQILDEIKINPIKDLLENNHFARAEGKLAEKFPLFATNYPFLLKKIVKNEDIEYLYKMLDNLKQVEQGNKKLEDVEMNLGENLAEKYLYKGEEIQKLESEKTKIDIMSDVSSASDVSSISDLE